MEKEQDRHDTFRSIQDIIHATHHPRVFARAGFYKYDQSVICFKCNLKIDISEINKVNDIVEYHTTKNPECIFARNLPPLPRSKLGSQYPIMTMHGQSNPNCKFAQGEAVGNVPISIASIAEAGFFYKGYRDHVYCFHCNLGICNWERNDNPWILHAMYNPDCPYIRKLGYAAIEQAKREKRLMYKKPAPHSPVTENDWDILMGLDITKKLQISEYPTCAIKDCLKDQIMKYRKPFCTIQECIMAIRLKITSYGKMDTGLWDRIIDYAKDKNYLLPNIKHDINEDNEAQDDKAEHIQFSDDTSVTIRDIHLKKNPDCRFAQGKPSPELLVEAGFYHIGISDHVQCFHCGVGLRNWEWDDDPWELHAKWNPDLYAVMRFTQMITKKKYESSYPIDNTEDPIYLFKQSTFISNIDPNIPEYGHEIFFKLPYPDHRILTHQNYNIVRRPEIQSEYPQRDENIEMKNLSRIEQEDKHDHTDEKRLCKVCMTDEVDVVILPCDHMVCCAKCLLTQSKCPICRGTIEKVVKPILL
ncbi:putative inhibitor of apoptosis [Penaeus chinensis]|uniref:putative inhibitor of apoptosis n=1 Tax=Penaeus chinensis TaxID=139456 RepID=UPI001FB59968|nr:putative inhibitor of apoptosis [Penaeus chinensis]XP_047468550.1 putative inhibitor of apoptosis [Penaeus chinensis]